jgi:hypothetical protein
MEAPPPSGAEEEPAPTSREERTELAERYAREDPAWAIGVIAALARENESRRRVIREGVTRLDVRGREPARLSAAAVEVAIRSAREEWGRGPHGAGPSEQPPAPWPERWNDLIPLVVSPRWKLTSHIAGNTLLSSILASLGDDWCLFLVRLSLRIDVGKQWYPFYTRRAPSKDGEPAVFSGAATRSLTIASGDPFIVRDVIVERTAIEIEVRFPTRRHSFPVTLATSSFTYGSRNVRDNLTVLYGRVAPGIADTTMIQRGGIDLARQDATFACLDLFRMALGPDGASGFPACTPSDAALSWRSKIVAVRVLREPVEEWSMIRPGALVHRRFSSGTGEVVARDRFELSQGVALRRAVLNLPRATRDSRTVVELPDGSSVVVREGLEWKADPDSYFARLVAEGKTLPPPSPLAGWNRAWYEKLRSNLSLVHRDARSGILLLPLPVFYLLSRSTLREQHFYLEQWRYRFQRRELDFFATDSFDATEHQPFEVTFLNDEAGGTELQELGLFGAR